MLKKIINITKATIICTVWSIIYFILARYIFLAIWKFDILITNDWIKIINFWNGGGVINKFKDITFVFSLLILVPLWIYTLFKFNKFDYKLIITYPIALYNSYLSKKYGSSLSDIRIKNLSSGGKDMTIGEMIEKKLKESEKNNNKELEATKIRNIIQDKIKNKT